jgi:hypothetical protein
VRYVTTNIGKEWVPIFFRGQSFAPWQKKKKKERKNSYLQGFF